MDLATIATFAAAFLVFAASPGPDNVTIVARTVSEGALWHRLWCRHRLRHPDLPAARVFRPVDRCCRDGLADDGAALWRAAYLIWMGIRLWLAPPIVPEVTTDRGRGGLFASFASGVVLNLGNPKMPLFYVALLPNVVGTNLSLGQVGVLSLVIVLVETLVIGGHVAPASRARTALRRPQVLRRVNRSCGAVMVGAGVAVVAAR
jgi:threonine/homoserine/homoserine lactone efflux protein